MGARRNEPGDCPDRNGALTRVPGRSRADVRHFGTHAGTSPFCVNT
jgi:hypothetical protein